MHTPHSFQVILSSATHLYFDQPQEPSPTERGFYWATRYTDTYKTFSFMPDNFYLNADIRRSGAAISMAEICGQNNAGCPPLTKPENIGGGSQSKIRDKAIYDCRNQLDMAPW